MRFIFVSLLLSLSTVLSSAFGQSIFDDFVEDSNSSTKGEEKVQLSGFARGVAYGGSEDFNYTNVFGEFALKGRLESANQKGFLFADMRVREGLFFNEHELQLQLKEAYAGYKSSKADIYLGNQIVTWGRTDGFNPTNVITPNDYFFLTHDPDDQKLSNFMLRTRLKPTSSLDIDVVAIPFYVSSVYRYELFDMGHPATFLSMKKPLVEFGKGAIGVRANMETSLIGFSASYFAGYNPFYGFSVNSFNLLPLSVELIPQPYFMQMVGADFELPVSSWMVRGEGALNLTKEYELPENSHIPNPDLSYVIGVEKSFFDIMAIFQYVGKYTFDFEELTKPIIGGITPEAIQEYAKATLYYEINRFSRKIFNQEHEVNHMLFLALNRSFMYDTFNLEVAGTYNITTEEYMFRSRLKWSVSDALSANVGCSYMLGPDEAIFHLAGKVMNGVFIGLEANF